jgi:hypothetical protein
MRTNKPLIFTTPGTPRGVNRIPFYRGRLALRILAIFLILLAVVPIAQVTQAQSNTVKEGNDFATQVLRDPWDMNQYSDVSQYLNDAGQPPSLQNIQVSNGVFSATSATKDPLIMPLFPGYYSMMEIGKVGNKYPIQASKYHCLYLAMNISNTSPINAYEVFWFQDSGLHQQGGLWGMTQQHTLVPNVWNLYWIDLNTISRNDGNTNWNGSTTWQGLRLDPAVVSGAGIKIDWIRLTDCSTSNVALSGLPNQKLTPYLNKSGYDIRLPDITPSSGNANLDVQGVEPGTYNYTIRNSSDQTVKTGQITINAAPIVNFAKPSPTSGAGYAEASGTDWSMSSPAGVTSFYCLMSHNFSGGILSFATQTLGALPGECLGGGYADPRIYLSTPLPAATNKYRYLTIRMNADGPWQNLGGGMMARLIWRIQGNQGSNSRCDLVSQDIPFDVGWNTYTIDLWDSFEGSSEQSAGSCPGLLSWLNSGNILEFRFDPNENQLGRVLNQQIDYFYLGEQDWVAQGNNYEVQILLSKSFDQIRSQSFYYTTNRSQPTQNNANISLIPPPAPPPPAGPFRVFIPSITNGTGGMSQSGTTKFIWNTQSVARGDYFLCMLVNDGLNSVNYCSETPVSVR